MVGYGIGACFLNYLGVNITDGNCTIEIPESLTVSSLSTLAPSAASYDVSVYANVSWTALSNDAWISIDTNSGTGNATVSVTVTENVNPSSRTGTVTFTQDPGGDDIVRTLNVTQEAADPRTGLNLINVLATDVDINYVSHEENVPPNKINLAPHSLDKNFNSYWAGDRTQHESGRAIIIYDLKGTFDLDLVDIATTGGKTYQLQIWVSSTGTDDIDFSNPFPPGDLISNTDASFKAFILPTTAVGTKHVKIIGNGQPSGSNFTSIHEIEFYGNSSLSIDDNDLANAIKMYPNPVKDILTLKNIGNNVNLLQVFSIDGRKVYEKTVNSSGSEIKLDMSPFANGTYILNVLDSSQTKQVKMIIVSH
jgi:poly(beta-D-mannuronate) lyase